jgi:hypothetical protein
MLGISSKSAGYVKKLCMNDIYHETNAVYSTHFLWPGQGSKTEKYFSPEVEQTAK